MRPERVGAVVNARVGDGDAATIAAATGGSTPRPSSRPASAGRRRSSGRPGRGGSPTTPRSATGSARR